MIFKHTKTHIVPEDRRDFLKRLVLCLRVEKVKYNDEDHVADDKDHKVFP
jgi:hypothetical protein